MNAGNSSQNGIGRLHMPHFIHGFFLSNGVEGISWIICLIDQSLLFVPSRKSVTPWTRGIPILEPEGGRGVEGFMGLDSHRIDRDDRFPTNKHIPYPACNLLNSRRHQYSASCRFVIHHTYSYSRFNREAINYLGALYLNISACHGMDN